MYKATASGTLSGAKDEWNANGFSILCVTAGVMHPVHLDAPCVTGI
jgi:hypothetical protein